MAKTMAGSWEKEWLGRKLDLEKVWTKENPKFDAKKELGKIDKAVQELRKLDNVISTTYMARPGERGKFLKVFAKQVTVYNKASSVFLKSVKQLVEKDPAKAKLKKPFADFQATHKKIDKDIQLNLGMLEQAAEDMDKVDPKDLKNLDKIKKQAPKVLRQVKVWVSAAAKEASVQLWNMDAKDKIQLMIVLGEAAASTLPQNRKQKAILMLVKELRAFQKKSELDDDADPKQMKKLMSHLLKQSEKLVKTVEKAELTEA